MLYVLDEPTTGLHLGDINELLGCFERLLESGATLLVIEHNMDVVKQADWVIDLGPEGGAEGGRLVFQGTPEAGSPPPGRGALTAPYLKARPPRQALRRGLGPVAQRHFASLISSTRLSRPSPAVGAREHDRDRSEEG